MDVNCYNGLILYTYILYIHTIKVINRRAVLPYTLGNGHLRQIGT